jgi:hypothetical protein
MNFELSRSYICLILSWLMVQMDLACLAAASLFGRGGSSFVCLGVDATRQLFPVVGCVKYLFPSFSLGPTWHSAVT